MTTHALYLLAISLPQWNKNKVQTVQDPRDMVSLYFKALQLKYRDWVRLFWENLPPLPRQAPYHPRPCWLPKPALGPAHHKVRIELICCVGSVAQHADRLPSAASQRIWISKGKLLCPPNSSFHPQTQPSSLAGSSARLLIRVCAEQRRNLRETRCGPTQQTTPQLLAAAGGLSLEQPH